MIEHEGGARDSCLPLRYSSTSQCGANSSVKVEDVQPSNPPCSDLVLAFRSFHISWLPCMGVSANDLKQLQPYNTGN